MVRLRFGEVRMAVDGDSPVLVLREAEGARILPVWISAAGAAAIVAALEGDDPGHPGTHDLMLEALAALDATVTGVRITAASDGVFDAQLTINEVVVTCRLSDGVALALRCGAPIEVAEAVLEAWHVPHPAEAPTQETDDEIGRFREFLDSVNPDDFTSQP